MMMNVVAVCAAVPAVLVLLSAAIGNAHAALDHTLSVEQHWALFKSQHGKEYLSREEHDARFSVFKQNFARVKQLNSLQEHGDPFGVTRFFDLTPEEFQESFLMKQDMLQTLVNERNMATSTFNKDTIPLKDVPASFDWRSKGAVTPVYNQGQCGSCWAFSTVENVESVWKIQGNHSLVELSTAQVNDCDSQSEGCNGGMQSNAYEYIMKYGLESAKDYPYNVNKPWGQQCQYNASLVVAHIDGWETVTKTNDEKTMQAYVYHRAPINIAANAMPWQYYTSGVLTTCPNQDIDHTALIVGYGDMTVDNDSVPYWIVKNTWGESWGENGYIYIQRGNNTCGIATQTSSAYINQKTLMA